MATHRALVPALWRFLPMFLAVLLGIVLGVYLTLIMHVSHQSTSPTSPTISYGLEHATVSTESRSLSRTSSASSSCVFSWPEGQPATWYIDHIHTHDHTGMRMRLNQKVEKDESRWLGGRRFKPTGAVSTADITILRPDAFQGSSTLRKGKAVVRVR